MLKTEHVRQVLKTQLVPSGGRFVYVVKLNDQTESKAFGEILTAVWIEKNFTKPWTIMVLDAFNFLEASWALSATQMTKRKYGISRDKTLCNVAEKFKVALNTLAVVEYVEGFTNDESLGALQALADVTVCLSTTPVERLKAPVRVIGLEP